MAEHTAAETQQFQFVAVDEDWQETRCTSLGLRKVFPVPLAAVKPCDIGSPRMVVQISEDGNCWFRSIAYYMSGDQDQHGAVRTAVTKFMRETIRKEVINFTKTKEKPNYFENWAMAEDKVWATDIEIFATAALLGTDIYVFTKPSRIFNKRLRGYQNPSWRWELFRSTVFQRVKGRPKRIQRSLYIFHQNRNHYMPVITTY